MCDGVYLRVRNFMCRCFVFASVGGCVCVVCGGVYVRVWVYVSVRVWVWVGWGVSSRDSASRGICVKTLNNPSSEHDAYDSETLID